MCDIAGMIDLKAGDDLIQIMLDTMKRRGPDSTGWYRDRGCTLLHARLVVIDPSGGYQPMSLSFGGENYTIVYNGELYLFHAPIDREHIGIIKINTYDLAESKVVLQAKMDTSCFYPFVQYGNDGELRMSYTVNRQHIRLAKFTLSDYID